MVQKVFSHVEASANVSLLSFSFPGFRHREVHEVVRKLYLPFSDKLVLIWVVRRRGPLRRGQRPIGRFPTLEIDRMFARDAGRYIGRAFKAVSLANFPHARLREQGKGFWNNAVRKVFIEGFIAVAAQAFEYNCGENAAGRRVRVALQHKRLLAIHDRTEAIEHWLNGTIRSTRKDRVFGYICRLDVGGKRPAGVTEYREALDAMAIKLPSQTLDRNAPHFLMPVAWQPDILFCTGTKSVPDKMQDEEFYLIIARQHCQQSFADTGYRNRLVRLVGNQLCRETRMLSPRGNLMRRSDRTGQRGQRR
ncbi:hypothetical protein Rsph17029_3725 [Rhodobacter sphaeroides ATCC 17029]|nr:hypothetical protein Rsph17029_3725 [Cereibacter sphaeroides ATCC 17029]